MDLPVSKFAIIVNIICILLCAGVAIFLGVTWQDIPAEIPGHYNVRGEIDRWTGKNELLIIPSVSLILFIAITVIERFPQIWNTGVTVTQENWPQVYLVIRNMLAAMKLEMVAIFAFLTINTALQRALPLWFLPAMLIAVFGSLIYFIARIILAR